MNAANHDPDPASPEFRIVWTLGFAGKRELPDPEQARQAVRAELVALLAAAEKERVRLVAVSSLAIGADLIFAEECLRLGLPWRLILPFAEHEFLRDDFSPDEIARFHSCRARAYAVEIAPLDPASVEVSADPARAKDNADKRCAAYRDGDYRVVECSDVVLVLWDGSRGGVGGTADSVSYADTLKKPVWCWNPQTGREERRGWPGLPGQGREKKRLFHARLFPELFATTDQLKLQIEDVATDNPRQRAVRERFQQLDQLAMQEQTRTKTGLQRVLTLHLAATIAAAISCTFFSPLPHPDFWLLAAVIALVSWGKPVCAALALHFERNLHHDGHQDQWVDARVAAEICRSALSTWSLPEQPENVFDVEDFPRFRRLIHSLQTTRALDQSAVAQRWDLSASATNYIAARLEDQMGFFQRKHAGALAQHRIWHRFFLAATFYVIGAGALLAASHTSWLHLHLPAPLEQLLACLLIVAPFLATYALAMQTIHDTRRRLTRNHAMAHYLKKQIEAIRRSRSTSARLRLIAGAERMLIEELHEWYSVTRHAAV